jgi:ABC-type Zn uptake system ZnuABC Zn-binding protein ZnuA
MKKLSLVLAMSLLIALLPGCQTAPATQVAATTLPVYEFTTTLCQGTGITVTRLVDESVSCLHDYSLSVSQVKALESAETVVISGAGLEEFMEDLLPEDTIDSSVGIEALECTEEHDHDHDHHHEQDSHIWLSPANGKIMAQNICSGLSAQYPQHQETFEKNLQNLLAKLDELQTYGQAQLQDLKCRDLVTFHDGFAYFADAFDLHILHAIEEESGREASAQELKHLIGIVREHNLPAVFTECNGSVSAADIICAETGAKCYALDMAMGGDSYFEAMYHNIDTIKEALG